MCDEDISRWEWEGGASVASYDYACDNCDYKATDVRSIHDPEPELECLNCGSELRKLFRAVPTHFKGSGWGSKPQLWTTNQDGKVEKYKGDIKHGERGQVKPKYS